MKSNKYTKKTHINNKHSNTHKHNKTHKLRGGDGQVPKFEELTPDQLNYYTNFMAMKADATTVLHEYENVKTACVEMCQRVTHHLCNEWTEVLKYIKRTVVPEIFSIEGTTNLSHENIVNFIKDETRNENEALKCYESFKKIQFGDNSTQVTEDDIERYSFLFYRFYLKGGNAFTFTVNSYNDKIIQFLNHQGQARILQDDEIINMLGKSSDYDFNLIINPKLSNEHYDMMSILFSAMITDFLVKLIDDFSTVLFNNDAFVQSFKQQLLANNPPLYAGNGPRQILKVKGAFNRHIGTNDVLQSIRNDPSKNKLGHVNINWLDIPSKYKGKGNKNAKFILIRLMSYFQNAIIDPRNDPKITHIFEKRISEICGEIIDISIPTYYGYEKYVKWSVDGTQLLKINGVYCYNLSIVLYDLKRMIDENIMSGEIAKLQKRKNRLIFFHNLACIIPRLIYTDKDTLYEQTGIKNFDKSCENIIKAICSEEIINKRPSLIENLQDILKGIYLNFPETINSSNMNIFILLKQYFRYYLIESISRPENLTYESDIIYKNDILINLEAITTDECKHIFNITYENQYFNIIEQMNGHFNCFTVLNIILYNNVCKIIDDLKIKSDTDENIKQYLCNVLVTFSPFIYSFSSFSVKYDGLIEFINFLKTINTMNNISSNQEVINTRQIINIVTNEYETFANELMKNIHFSIINFSLLINDHMNSNLFLYGSYAYNIHKLLHKIVEGQIINEAQIIASFNDSNTKFNDINMGIVLNTSPSEYPLAAYEIYKRYVDLFQSNFASFTILNELPYKIYMDICEENMQYKIRGSINIYQPVNDKYVNMSFNKLNYNTNNKYRILSYDFFTLYVSNQMPDLETYSTISAIIGDTLYLNTEAKQQWFDAYNNVVNNGNTTTTSVYNINFYISNLYGITSNYQQKIDDPDLDALIKNKYMERMLEL